jgi:uncharacterized protein with FMN-binding domain
VRTRAKVASVLSSGAVLLLGWQLGSHAPTGSLSATAPASTSGTTASGGAGTASGSTSTPTTGTTSGGTTSRGATSTPTPSTSTSTASSKDGTYTGDSVSTRYGNVQVSVTISGGAITDVKALRLTDDEQRSVQISASAAPILREEVLSAQSANVSIVSRATYTSDAYLQSVQSALSAAGW